MPWKKTVKTTECPKPRIGRKEPGSVWQCPICGRDWIVNRDPWNMKYFSTNLSRLGPCTKEEIEE